MAARNAKLSFQSSTKLHEFVITYKVESRYFTLRSPRRYCSICWMLRY